MDKQDITPSALLDAVKQKADLYLEEYPELKSILYKRLFNKIPIVANKIPKDDNLYRTVPIYRQDISIGRKKYLSYRPTTCKYPFFNRCSEPEQSHFYCSTDRHLSITECSYFLSKIDDPNPVFDKSSERLEVGTWLTTRDLYVADMRFAFNPDKEVQAYQQQIKLKYRDFVKDQFVFDFFEYINDSFQVPIKKEEHLKYWLTACYSNYLFDDTFNPQSNFGTMKEIESASNVSLDGILYNSVKGIKTNPPLNGVNLALKTNTIDNKAVVLIKAGIFETQLVAEKEFNLDILIKLNKNIQGDSWTYMNANDQNVF
jgi:hypothetical protein